VSSGREPTILLVAGVLASGCLRAPIGDDQGDGSAELGSSDRSDEGSTGLGATDSRLGDDDDAETSRGPDACHPSYAPCLPIVDDLDCSDVIALGVAPVTVLGSDDYGLDSDHDGLGCEP